MIKPICHSPTCGDHTDHYIGDGRCEVRYTQAFNEGYDACNSGKSLIANPYICRPEYEEWRSGWEYAQFFWNDPDSNVPAKLQ